MKNIAILTPVFPYPRRGVYTGIERHIEGLSYSLARIKSVKVKVITSHWNNDNNHNLYTEINGISIYRVSDLRQTIGRLSGFAELDFLSLGFQMYRKLKELRKHDFLIFNLPFPYSRLIRVPSATLLHHYQPMSTFGHALSVPFGNAYFKMMKTNVYIAPSRYTAAMFTRYLGVDQSKIKIIHEGVDPRFASGRGEKIREEIGGGKILLYVGNLTFSKGVLELLHTFRRVSDIIPDARLVYVGDGPLRGALQNEIKSLGLEKKVFLKGFVDDKELPDYYAACDIFVSFSTLEGFGLTFAEAMSAGKPIIAFNAASIAEVVGDAGLLAAPTSDNSEVERNMITLLTDDSLREQMCLRSKQRSELYSWNHSALDLVNTLENLTIASLGHPIL